MIPMGDLWWDRPDLNRDCRFRKPVLYPFKQRPRKIILTRIFRRDFVWTGTRLSTSWRSTTCNQKGCNGIEAGRPRNVSDFDIAHGFSDGELQDNGGERRISSPGGRGPARISHKRIEEIIAWIDWNGVHTGTECDTRPQCVCGSIRRPPRESIRGVKSPAPSCDGQAEGGRYKILRDRLK